MDPVEAAWFAGLFEGEGCITRTTRHNRWGDDLYYYTLKVNMTDEDVVRKISRVTGYSSLYGPHQPRGSGTKPYWVWECQNRAEMIRILTAIRPHLGQRRGERADEVLAWSKAKDARIEQRQVECRHGHDLTAPDATYVDSKGTTMCRLCRNEKARRSRHAKIEQAGLCDHRKGDRLCDRTSEHSGRHYHRRSVTP